MVANTIKDNMTARDSFLDFGSDLTWEAFGNDQQAQQQGTALSSQGTPDKPHGKKRSSGKSRSSKERLQDETTKKKKSSSRDKDGTKKKKSSSKDKESNGKKKKKGTSNSKKSTRKLLDASSSSLNFSVGSGDGNSNNDDDGSLAERSMDESYDGDHFADQRSPSRSRSPVASSKRNIKQRLAAAALSTSNHGRRSNTSSTASEEAADGFEVTQSACSIPLFQMRQKFKKDFPDEPVPSDLVLRQLYKAEQIAIYELRDRFRSENLTAAMPSDDELRRMYQQPLSGEVAAAPSPAPATTPRSKVVKPALDRDVSTGENSEGGDSADMTVMTFATEAGWEAYGKSARQVTPTPAFDAFNTTALEVMEEGEEEEDDGGDFAPRGSWEAAFGPDKVGKSKTSGSKADPGFSFSPGTPKSPTANFANDELTQEDLFNSSFADDIIGSPEVDTSKQRSLPSSLDAFHSSFGALEVAESLGGGSLHGDMMSASSGQVGGRREGSRRGRRKVDRDIRDDDRLSRSEHGPPDRSRSNDRSRRGRRKVDADMQDDDYGRFKSKDRSFRGRRKVETDIADDDYDDSGMTKSRHGSSRRFRRKVDADISDEEEKPKSRRARRKVDADIEDDDGGRRRAKSSDRGRRGRRRGDTDYEEEVVFDDGPTRGVGRTKSAPMQGYNRSRSRDRPARSRDRMGSSTHKRRTHSDSSMDFHDNNDSSSEESGDDGAVVPATPSFHRSKVREFESPFTPSPSISILEEDFQAPKTPDQNPFALSSRRINPPRSDGSFGRARSKSRERPRETEKKSTSKYRKIKFVPKPKDRKSDTSSKAKSVSGAPSDDYDEEAPIDDDGFMTSLAALDHAAADRDQSGGGWASTRPQQQQQKRQSQSSRNGWAIDGVPGALRNSNTGIDLEVGYSENVSPLTAATRKPMGRIAARRMGAPF